MLRTVLSGDEVVPELLVLEFLVGVVAAEEVVVEDGCGIVALTRCPDDHFEVLTGKQLLCECLYQSVQVRAIDDVLVTLGKVPIGSALEILAFSTIKEGRIEVARLNNRFIKVDDKSK